LTVKTRFAAFLMKHNEYNVYIIINIMFINKNQYYQ